MAAVPVAVLGLASGLARLVANDQYQALPTVSGMRRNGAHPVGHHQAITTRHRRNPHDDVTGTVTGEPIRAALSAAVAGIVEDSNVTADQLRQMINDAVAGQVKITGHV